MEIEEFEKIMDEDSDEKFSTEGGCKVFKGLKIITKYLPKEGIASAQHDIIYSCYAERLVEAGITIEDANLLRDLNWMIDEDSLAHFV